MIKKIAIVVAILALGCSSALAQPGPGGRGGRPPMEPMRMGMCPVTPLDMLDWIELSADQKARLVVLFKKEISVLDTMGDESGPGMPGMAGAHDEAMQAMHEASMLGDVDTVRTLARTQSAKHEERIVRMAIFMSELRGILTEAQRARIDHVRKVKEARREALMASSAPEREERPEGAPDGRPGEKPAGKPDAGMRRGQHPTMRQMIRDSLEAWIKQNS